MFLSKVEKLDLLNRTNNTGWREYLLAEHKFLCASLGWGGLPLKWKESEERIYILHGNLFQDKTLWSCNEYLIYIARDMHMYFFSTLIWHLLLFRTKKRRAGKLPPRHLRVKTKLELAESNCIRAEIEVAKMRSIFASLIFLLSDYSYMWSECSCFSYWAGQLESDVSAQAQILNIKDAELVAAKKEVSIYSYFPPWFLNSFLMCVCERERMKYSSNPAGKEMNNNMFYIFIVQNVFHFTFICLWWLMRAQLF